MDTCEYPECEERALRHLMGRHFCSDCRQKAIAEFQESDQLELYRFVQDL